MAYQLYRKRGLTTMSLSRAPDSRSTPSAWTATIGTLTAQS